MDSEIEAVAAVTVSARLSRKTGWASIKLLYVINL